MKVTAHNPSMLGAPCEGEIVVLRTLVRILAPIGRKKINFGSE
jgi:hypothetical protein